MWNEADGRFDATIEVPGVVEDVITSKYIVDPCIYGSVSPAPLMSVAAVECLRQQAWEEGKNHVSHPKTREEIDIFEEPVRVLDVVQTVYEAMKKISELETKLETDVESLIALEADKQILTLFIEQLEEDAKLSTAENIDARSRINALINKVEETSKHIDRLTRSVKETETQKDELQGRVNSMSEERERKALEFASVYSEQERIAQVKENNYKKQIQDLTSETALLKATMVDMAKEKSELSAKLVEANNEKQDLQVKVTELTQSVESRDSTIGTLNDRVQDIVYERSQLKAQAAIATSQVKTLSSEVEAKTKAVANMEQSLQETNDKYETDVNALAADKRILAQSVEQLEQKVKSSAVKNSEARSRIANLTNEGEERSKLIDKLTKSIEENKTEKSDLSTQLAEKMTTLEHAAKAMEGFKADLENEVSITAALKSQVGSLKKAKQELAEEVERQTEKAGYEQAAKAKAEALLEACTIKQNEVQSRLDQVNKDLKDAKETIQTSMETISELKSDRASLEAAKADVDTELVETRGKLDSLCAEKQSLSEDLEARRANEIALTDQLQNLQGSFGAARKEIDTLKASLVEMEPQRKELNATLATLSDDEGRLESQVVVLQSSKAKVDTKLAEAVDRLAALETDKQGPCDDILACQANEKAQKEKMRDTQTSPEATREEIDSLQINISEVEGTLTKPVEESEVSCEGPENDGSEETRDENAGGAIQDLKSQGGDDGSVSISEIVLQ